MLGNREKSARFRLGVVFCGLSTFTFLAGCGGGGGGGSTSNPTTPSISVSVTPTSATLSGGGTQAFTATVTNDSSNAGVTWSIGSGTGTLSNSTTTGVTYTAPSAISAASTVTLTATSVADAAKSATATITLTAPVATISGVAVTCNPVSIEIWETSQCTATVTGTGSYSSAVTWSAGGVQGGNSTVGTISTTGLYTAPSAVPSTNPVTITAVSTADTTKSGSSTLTITAASGTPSITALSETTANPFDSLTITGTAFNQGTEAISVIFTPESGDTAVMVPVSATTPTSLGVMVPTFSNSSGAFTAETVDVQVVLFSSTTTYLTNTIKGLPVAVLPPVPSGVAAGTMTAALLSSATKTSTTVQGVGTGETSLANVSSSLSQLDTDISPLTTAATTIAGDPTKTVNLTTANGTTTPLNAKILAHSDQLAQALMAAMVNQGSIPSASSTSACPTATGNTAFDNNLCNAQIYFQTYASQATPGTSAAGQKCMIETADPVLSLTPPDAAMLTFFANITLGGLAEVCEPAGGGLLYSVVGAPIVSSYISSLAVKQEMPSGTEVAAGVGTALLDRVAYSGTPVIGTAVDLYGVLSALINYSPPERGILLSSGIATYTPGQNTFFDPNNGTGPIMVKLPNAPAGGSFDSTTLVISQSGQLTLSLSVAGSGSGTIASFPTGTTFPKGTVVLLTAVPATGSTFTGWSGACSGTGSCSVTMNSNESVTATFEKSTFDLTVSTAGTGTGTIAKAPTGTSCGSGCSSYDMGTTVQLTASPSSGSAFAGWSGACSGTGSCSVTMNSNESVTATFNQNLLDLNWSTAGTGSGTIAVSPAGTVCGTDCYSYASGTAVSLTATAGTNSTFTGWSGSCSGTGACNITMNSNESATATFTSSNSGSTPSAGSYTGSCVTGYAAFSCDGATIPGYSDTEPFDFTVSSGTSLSQLNSELCSQVEPALITAGCTSATCSDKATSNSVDLSLSCTISVGCTVTVTEVCTAND